MTEPNYSLLTKYLGTSTCIYRSDGNLVKQRCGAVFAKYNANQVCCADHQLSYAYLSTRKRRALKSAAVDA